MYQMTPSKSSCEFIGSDRVDADRSCCKTAAIGFLFFFFVAMRRAGLQICLARFSVAPTLRNKVVASFKHAAGIEEVGNAEAYTYGA